MRWMIAVVCALVTGLAATPAHGFAIVEKGGPASAGNGIAIGPDGNFWVAEEFARGVARIALDGTVLQRFDVGERPTDIAVSPDGKVWATVPGEKKLVWFDATAATPTDHDVPINSPCGPVAIVAGGDGNMYFSLPSPDGCNGGTSRMGMISSTGMGPATIASAGGTKAFDLVVAGGYLFAPDFDFGLVRRLALGTLGVEGEVSIATENAGPDGITADNAGNIWVTEFLQDKVAKFPANQDGGLAQEFTATGGPLANPFGIVQGVDGNIYIAGKGSSNIARVTPDGASWQFYSLQDAEPWVIINGTDGDLYFTDQKKTRILRLVNTAPRITPGAVAATGPTSASAQAAVNPRGNDTQVSFQYGKTNSYGKSTDPITVPTGVDNVAVTGVLSKLKSETTYHVRAVATNAEGTALGPDATIKTDPFPELATNTSIRVSVHEEDGRQTVRVESISITRLRGTETATITCKGKKCPFKRKRFNMPKGTKEFGAKLLKNRTLPPGTVVSVGVSAPKTIGTSTVLRVLKNKGQLEAPIKRACLRPGKPKPSKCP